MRRLPAFVAVAGEPYDDIRMMEKATFVMKEGLIYKTTNGSPRAESVYLHHHKNHIAMYIVREIFQLQFGRYKEAKALIDKGLKEGVLQPPAGSRMLTDFTGEGYRLILESPFRSLGDWETELKREMTSSGWSEWYEQFKQLIRNSEREILKHVGSEYGAATKEAEPAKVG
jgi:hypothetical protein